MDSFSLCPHTPSAEDTQTIRAETALSLKSFLAPGYLAQPSPGRKQFLFHIITLVSLREGQEHYPQLGPQP
jgi:hypothetical protein